MGSEKEMNLKKKITYFSQILLSVSSAFAVQVVQNTPNKESEALGAGLATIVIGVFIIGLLSLAFIVGFILVLMKIYKKLSEYRRNKSDFIYSMFSRDAMQCHTNRDKDMKFRNWKFLWIFWKRVPVFARTSDGLEALGMYNGEALKKESYYMISIFNKLTMFKAIDQIVIIPLSIKSIVSKIVINGQKVIIIEADGIDQVANTDYYFQPLIKDPKSNKDYLDFADAIHKDYIEKTIYRDIIKENLQIYRDGVTKAVEANPYVQTGRRKQ